jgi:hypothetical protein
MRASTGRNCEAVRHGDVYGLPKRQRIIRLLTNTE